MFNDLHHIGIVVEDIDAAEKFYENILGLTKTHREVIPDQAIEAVLLNAKNCEIELLKPIDDVSGVAKYLEKFGSKFHHLCFTVDEIEVELSRINNLPMELIDKSPRKGLVGEVAFIHPKSTNGILVEIAQPKDQEIIQNPIHMNEVILKNNNNSIIQNWNNLLLNDFQAISPNLRFVDNLQNDDRVESIILSLQYEDIEQIINNLNNNDIDFTDGADYYPNQISSIFIDGKNSYGLDIICLEF